VVSAAHCVCDVDFSMGKGYNYTCFQAENLKVGLGKLFVEISHSEDAKRQQLIGVGTLFMYIVISLFK